MRSAEHAGNLGLDRARYGAEFGLQMGAVADLQMIVMVIAPKCTNLSKS
jgi:hypothetical protein